MKELVNLMLRPLPSITWSKLDGELPKARMRDLRSPEADFGRSIVVDNIQPQDAGDYECSVSPELSHLMRVYVTGLCYSAV